MIEHRMTDEQTIAYIEKLENAIRELQAERDMYDRHQKALQQSYSDALAELNELSGKALAYDLDHAGIANRNAEAVELVEARIELYTLREEIARLQG